MNKTLEKYYSLLEEMKHLNSISALLSLDQETNMPPLAIEGRSKQMGYVEKLIHSKITAPEYINTINSLYDQYDDLSEIDKRSVLLSKREMDRSTKLSSQFVEEFAEIKSKAQNAWFDAKQKEDYGIFKPLLQKTFEYTSRYADLIDNSKKIYDVLLDDYEEGMTVDQLNNIFNPLRDELTQILNSIPERSSKNVFKSQKFDKDITRKLIKEMTAKIGYDYNKGALGEVHHPFETRIGDNDVRINVKYQEDELSYTLTGAIHEEGHGIYEQNVNPEYFKTSFGEVSSLALHESQSRLLENMIGRSKPFWKYFIKVLQKYYPEMNKFNYEDAYSDLNLVKRSFIRTESDEVTYNLHIILRFEIEQAILNKEVKIDEIPEVWNSKMQKMLGVTPKLISEGCLQDVHWSMGAIGYFPTYSLGNLTAGQWFNKFTIDHPDYEKQIESGDFSGYFNWFKTNVWNYGSLYTCNQLLKKITGEELNPKYFIKYIKEKYVK